MKNNLESNDVLYNEIKQVLISSRKEAYRAVNQSIIKCYHEIGRIIVQKEQNGNDYAKYGKATLKDLSSKLTKEFGSGFDRRNLSNMRKFYLLYPNWNAVRTNLSWTHYRAVLKLDDEKERNWYLEEASKEQWSSRQLNRQISTFYYQRLLSSQDKKPVKDEAKKLLKKQKSEDFIKDPYVLEFLNLKDYPALRESELELALIDKLQDFLLELGRGFCFVSRQKRMRFEDEDFYLDLVFYHSILKCHILIDLKIGKLTHSDVGQMDSYIRMFDELYKNDDDNPTLGLILCSSKNEAIVKYSILNDAKQIFASKYSFTLPSIKELEHQLQIQREELEEK